jgi:hypothetical protein
MIALIFLIILVSCRSLGDEDFRAKYDEALKKNRILECELWLFNFTRIYNDDRANFQNQLKEKTDRIHLDIIELRRVY